MNVEREVLELLSNFTDKEIKLESNLYNDLSLDSLDIAQLEIAIADLFDLEDVTLPRDTMIPLQIINHVSALKLGIL